MVGLSILSMENISIKEVEENYFMSRVKNSQLNLIYGLINQLVIIILNFISRTMFIKFLGVNYLGLNGLFTNILSILSLAELGVGSAIMFSLYKPLENKDVEKVKGLMQLYKSSYTLIGVVVFVAGLFLLPFLDLIVNFDSKIEINYYMIYILFLLDSVISYLFFAYRRVIIEADQKLYIITKITMYINIFSVIIQIISLLLFKNYYIYLIIPIISRICGNILISKKSKILYPYLKDSDVIPLGKEEKKEIFKNVYALTLTKLSSVIYSSSDNIVISSILGTILVGLYSNYLLIISTVTAIIGIIFGSIKASIGNLFIKEDKTYNFIVYKRILFLNFWLYGFCAICLRQLLNPFIKIWIGKEYIFNESIVDLIVLMFLISGLNHTLTVYKDACGLFWATRYRTLLTALVNLITSIILAHFIGIAGIFLGTIIAYMTTIFIIDPKIIYNNIFNSSPVHFYKWWIKSLMLISFTDFIINCIKKYFVLYRDDCFIYLLVLTILISNIVFYIFMRQKEEFIYYKELIIKLFNRKLRGY